MKPIALATFLIVSSISSLHANRLDDLLRDLRAGRSVSVSLAESYTLLEPAVERYKEGTLALYVGRVKMSLVDERTRTMTSPDNATELTRSGLSCAELAHVACHASAATQLCLVR
jgi:hypothetical protein